MAYLLSSNIVEEKRNTSTFKRHLINKHATWEEGFMKRSSEKSSKAFKHGYRSTAMVSGTFTAELRESRAAIGPLIAVVGYRRHYKGLSSILSRDFKRLY